MKNESIKDKTSRDYIVRSLIAGGIAGSVAKTVTAPLDRVKILFQGSNSTYRQFSGSVFGAFRAVQYTVQNEGIYGCYKGHGAMLIRIFPYAAINYMAYEQYKRIILPSDSSLYHPLSRLVAGSLAGATSVTLTYPLDFVRTRLAYQVKTRRYQGILHVLSDTIKNEGVLAIYKGFGPTILGIIPYAGISFSTYETLKILTNQHFKENVIDPTTKSFKIRYKLLFGAIAGAMAQTVAYPLDVIRRRMQLYGLSTELPLYRNSFHAIMSILKADGFKGLFVGLSINYIKVAPSMSISFVTYEAMKKILGIQSDTGGVTI